jgi:nicotinamidase-related amidase
MTIGIFIIDMLNDFRDGVLANPRMEFIIPKIIELIERRIATREDIKIYFLCDSHKQDDKEFRLFPPHCLEGTHGAQVIDELRRYIKNDRSNVILKNQYSGFYKTGLDELLEREKLESVVLTGVLTEVCVLLNAEEFRYRGYETRIPRDCIETYDAPNHAAESINDFAFNYMANILGARLE